MIEESLYHLTILYAKHPEELNSWAGRTEVRKHDPNLMIEIVQNLVDHFHEFGKWQFALDKIPLTPSQEEKVKEMKKK